MNRFIQTVFLLCILIFPAFGQEGEPAPENRDSLALSRDTLTLSQDTLTIPYDTLGIYRQMDSIYNIGEPELRMSASLGRDSVFADSLVAVVPPETRSPSKAIMYALVLPGLGQAYNQKYWKMPIVWAAIGGAGYAIAYNTGEYRQASINYAQTPDDINQRYLEFWRRNMELSYIAMIVVYALQVLDAYVDAQLFSWDVNENLAIGISPSLKPLMAPGSINGYSYGLGCSFNIRGR